MHRGEQFEADQRAVARGSLTRGGAAAVPAPRGASRRSPKGWQPRETAPGSGGPSGSRPERAASSPRSAFARAARAWRLCRGLPRVSAPRLGRACSGQRPVGPAGPVPAPPRTVLPAAAPHGRRLTRLSAFRPNRARKATGQRREDGPVRSLRSPGRTPHPARGRATALPTAPGA